MAHHVDLAALHLVGAHLEGGDGAALGRIRQAARAGQPLAQPHDAGEGVDDLKPVPHRLGDQQAAVVGAEVQRRVDAIGGGRAQGGVVFDVQPGRLCGVAICRTWGCRTGG